jgi:dihydroorotate dehydrogenase
MNSINFLDTAGLLEELTEYRPKAELIDFLKIDEHLFERLKSGERNLLSKYAKDLIYYSMRHNLGDVLEYYVTGLPSYNQFSSFSFKDLPLGYSSPAKLPAPTKVLPTKIAGRSVGFPIGIPASVLTGTSKWVEFYAKKGFDILTYKTVRTLPWEVHSQPNLAFITKQPQIGDVSDFNQPFYADSDYIPLEATDVTLANSFGIPSLSPKEWQEDVQRTKRILNADQLLIVSVTGTAISGETSFEYLLNDFVKAASMARDAGADAIELNLSCPNVKHHRAGYIYKYPEEARQVVEAVWQKATGKGEVPLFMKIGYLDPERLTEVVKQTASFIAGIVAINTISAPILDVHNNQPFFPSDYKKGTDRTTAGISGKAIRVFAQEIVKNLSTLRERQRYDFDILATGGVSDSKHLQDYLDLGANGVLSCTGALVNSNLALEIRQQLGFPAKGDYQSHNINYPNTEREVIKMSKDQEKKVEVIPDIEPGYGRRKPTPIENPRKLIEEAMKKSRLLRELLGESGAEKHDPKSSK